MFSNDPIFQSIEKEKKRQDEHLELIASENFVSKDVLRAAGTVLTNKYAEGYPGKRYYGGCEYIDEVENLAIDRLKQLFDVSYANVQPHSGASANLGVFFALLKPGDTIMGMRLDCGGHLTHGHKMNLSGTWFKAVGYGVDPINHLIDYNQVRDLALEHRPRLIIAGGSAYPRAIDFGIFKEIANEVGAYFMVDMAHFAGLVAGGVFPSPVPYADVITSTTHKTLRGIRGGIVITNNEMVAQKIDKGIFPGIQGGPLMHIIAAKAIGFAENLRPEFKTYAKQIIKNTQAFGKRLMRHGFELITGGSDTHLLLVDLRNKDITGHDASNLLESMNITCNKNTVPYDPLSPMVTSGLRFGVPAMTTRGFKEAEFELVADLINDALIDGKNVKDQVLSLCKKFLF